MSNSNQESSVLFSLRELMTIEEDRIASEENERTSAAAAAEQARLEAERAAVAAEQARIHAHEERRRVEEQRAREEATRLEAIRQGEIAKAQAEAQQRARMEAMASQQEHERRLTALTQDRSKKRLRNAVIGVSAFTLVAGGVGVFWYLRESELNERQRVLTEQAQRDKERSLAEEAKLRAAAEARIAKLEGQLTGLQADSDEAQRLRAQLDDAKKSLGSDKPTAPPRSRGNRPSAPSQPARPAPVACAPGDPLCSDI